MNYYPKQKNYPVGSKVQHKTRYVHIKQQEGGWKSEHRWIMEEKVLGRELEPGEKVFHKDGVKDHNAPDNLVVIKFSTEKFVPLKKSVVLFIPKFKGRVLEHV